MTDFLTFQSIVQYRVPVREDGTLGDPQIVQKFTTAIKGTQHKKVVKTIMDVRAEMGEEVLL